MRTRLTSMSASIAGAVLLAPTLAAAALTQVSDFGDNPSGLSMFVHVPAKPAAKPPIVVAIHYCSGSASAYYTGLGSSIAALADRHGYIVIYPQTTRYGNCWDVFSPDSLAHGGGSDSKGIVSMVEYALEAYHGDADRVYVVGNSSGAMMTNVLLGAYPDVFKAGASFSGVPFGCWIGADARSGWNSACATGQVAKTPEQWGALVRAAYPSFSGTRPRVQIWHGDVDDTIHFNNFGEMVESWTNVLGVGPAPTTTETNAPRSGFTRTRYADSCGNVRVEAVREGGQGHAIAAEGAEVVRFFGLDREGPDPGLRGCGDAGAPVADAGNDRPTPPSDAGSLDTASDARPGSSGRGDGGNAAEVRDGAASSGSSGSRGGSGARANSGSRGSAGAASGSASSGRAGGQGSTAGVTGRPSIDDGSAEDSASSGDDSKGSGCSTVTAAARSTLGGLASLVLGLAGIAARRRRAGRRGRG